VVNGFWDPLFFYKEKPALFYTTYLLTDVYNEEKTLENPVLDFKYKLDKEIVDEAKKFFKGKKTAFGIVSSIKENGTPELMTLATAETQAVSCILGFSYYGS
jgi:hypothetical protein